MLGYLKREEETRAVLTPDGWYRSDDVAYSDDRGYLYIVGRLKDMIASGGENVYCTEVELALFDHPDVAECAVFGVPDPRWGERVHAVVVPGALTRSPLRSRPSATGSCNTWAYPRTRIPSTRNAKGADPMASTSTGVEGPTREEGDLTGRVALVTGGTRGIGAAISRRLASRGAVVAAGYSSNRERAEAFLEQIKPTGWDVTLYQGNVGDPDDCTRVVDEVIANQGRLDILVNNAGVTEDHPIARMTVDDWHKVLRVNLSGAFYMIKPALDHMLERGSGRIINMSSVVGERGNIGQANYAASKSGLFGLTKTLALEAAFMLNRAGKLGPDSIGLTVNTVTPGLIETDMAAAMPEKAIARMTAMIPVQRMGHPDEIARVVAFLADDSSAYITGQVWGVNGGFDM